MEKNHIIDKCEACGFVSFSVIVKCPVCGNMILTSEKLDEETFREQVGPGFKKGVKQILDSPIWQAERAKRKQ